MADASEAIGGGGGIAPGASSDTGGGGGLGEPAAAGAVPTAIVDCGIVVLFHVSTGRLGSPVVGAGAGGASKGALAAELTVVGNKGAVSVE